MPSHPLPLPADLSVKALAEWLRPMRLIGPAATCALQARAVRSLLADVARKAAKASPGFVSDSVADAIVSRILGPEVAP